MYILEILFRNGVRLTVETASKPVIRSESARVDSIGWEGSEPNAELYLQYVNYSDVSAVLVTNTMPDYEFTVDHHGMKTHFSIELLRAVNNNSDKVAAVKDLRNRTNLGLKEAKDIIEMLATNGKIRETLKGSHLTEDNPAFIVRQ